MTHGHRAISRRHVLGAMGSIGVGMAFAERESASQGAQPSGQSRATVPR
jgi:hypothetical protein